MSDQEQDREILANAPLDQPLNDLEQGALWRERDRERKQLEREYLSVQGQIDFNG